jgi:diamine N-acetyltransferase
VSVQVRTAEPADVERLVALAVELHEFMARGVPERLRIPHDDGLPALHRLIEEMIADPRADLLVALDDGDTVGFAELHLDGDPDDPAVQSGRFVRLQSLVVTEERRGRGIGRRLVEASGQWAAERGAPELRLHCWEFDGGPEPFYRALGFRTVKREMARQVSAGD